MSTPSRSWTPRWRPLRGPSPPRHSPLGSEPPNACGYGAVDLAAQTAGRPGDQTRAALIAAAERLMSQHGIDGVELKTIMREAGARNRSAIDYHFGNREGLVHAIGAKHRPPINAARN